MVSLWPLFLKRTVPITRRVPASRDQILAVMQDLEKVTRTSPLFVEGSLKAEGPADPGFTWYAFKEHVPPMFGVIPSRDIVVRIMWGVLADGTEARVFAALGTHLVNRVTVTEVPKDQWESPDQEECIIEEKINVEAFSLFIPYITSTVEKAHLAMFDGVIKQILADAD